VIFITVPDNSRSVELQREHPKAYRNSAFFSGTSSRRFERAGSVR
jgi:hypothetical protein